MYHVNPKTGKTGDCRALKACPFGGIDEHFTSEEAARKFFESTQKSPLSSSSKRRKPIPLPTSYAEFSETILKTLPSCGESSVALIPTKDESSGGVIEYQGALVSTTDANGKWHHQGIKEAVAGVRELLKKSREAGEIPSWLTTTVRDSTIHWNSPSLTITVGYRKAGKTKSIPNAWLARDKEYLNSPPSTIAGKRIKDHLELIARSYETYYSNMTLDDRNVSNRGKIEWL